VTSRLRTGKPLTFFYSVQTVYVLSCDVALLIKKDAFPYGMYAMENEAYTFEKWRFLKSFYCTLFNAALSAAPQIPMCRSMLELNPGLMRICYWQLDILTLV
jgi:hypothetical protein